jgi:hypothetical protein
VTHAELAAEHVAKAEELLASRDNKFMKNAALMTVAATQATVHATLALYHQREAERES